MVSADGHPVRGGSVFGVGEGEVDAGRARSRSSAATTTGCGRWSARSVVPSPTPGSWSPRAAPRSWSSCTEEVPTVTALVRGRADRRGGRRGSRRSWHCRCRRPWAPARGRARCSTTACSPRSPRTAWVSACCSRSSGWPSPVAPSVDRRRSRWPARPSPPGPSPPTGTRARVERRAGDRRRPLAPVGRGCVGRRPRPPVAHAPRPPRRGRPLRHHRPGRDGSPPSPRSMVVLVGVTGGVLALAGGREPRRPHRARGTASCSWPRWRSWRVVAALGAYNHFRLVPALTRGKATAALAQLWTTIRLEVAPRWPWSWPSPRCWWW